MNFLPAVSRGITLTALLLFLCSCTTTVQPQTGFSEGSSKSNLPIVENDSESRLKNMSLPELLQAGSTYLANNDSQLAGLHFSAALNKNPNSAAALTGLGEIQRRNGELNQADAFFKKALEKDRQYLPALLATAKVSRAQGDNETALVILARTLELSPGNIEALTEKAMVHDSLGQETQAEPLYAKVVSLRPELAFGYNNLGYNYLRQERYTEAIATFSRAMSLEPGNKRTHNNLAAAYTLYGDEESALQLFEKSVGKAAAYNNIGYIYMTKGQWDKAEKAFKHALDLNPRFYLRAQENLDRLNRLRSKPQP